jgi:hypothetical protein
MDLHIGICEDNLIHRPLLIDFIEAFLKQKDLPFKLYEFKSGEELLEKYTSSLDILLLDRYMDKLARMDTFIHFIDMTDICIIFYNTIQACDKINDLRLEKISI